MCPLTYRTWVVVSVVSSRVGGTLCTGQLRLVEESTRELNRHQQEGFIGWVSLGTSGRQAGSLKCGSGRRASLGGHLCNHQLSYCTTTTDHHRHWSDSGALSNVQTPLMLYVCIFIVWFLLYWVAYCILLIFLNHCYRSFWGLCLYQSITGVQ